MKVLVEKVMIFFLIIWKKKKKESFELMLYKLIVL